MFVWATLLVFLSQLCLTACYVSYEIQSFDSSTLTDAEEFKGPRSICECVMRCQRKTREGFYTNDNKCFCHNGAVQNQGKENGISTKKIDFINDDKCEYFHF